MAKVMPIINPDTGEVGGIPPRYRARFETLDEHGQAILDPRPLAAAIAFNHETSLDARMHAMLEHAMQDMYVRIMTSKEDFYDDDGFYDDSDITPPEEIDPRYISPGEFIYDETEQREVPRLLAGVRARRKAFKELNKPQPSQPTSPTKKPSSKPLKSKSEDGDIHVSEDGDFDGGE